MLPKVYLTILATSSLVAARAPLPRQDCRFHVTQLKFQEEPSFGRHLEFGVSILSDPTRSYVCSIAKMYARNNVPQWDEWTYDGCDVVGEAPPTTSGLEPRFSFKFNTARVAAGGLPKDQGMSLSLQLEESAAESRSAKANMRCEVAEPCDEPCDVTDCRIEPFCL